MDRVVATAGGGMDISINRDEIAPPPQMEMFKKRDQRFSQAQLELHRDHAAMQLKAFTKWWNSWLEPRSLPVTDLLEQIKAGVISVNLISALSGQKVKKYNKNPINRFQMGENNLIFLQTVKSKGITLVNIGPDDLYTANETLVLGVTWTLILRYEVQKYGAGEMELLKWVEKTTEGYDGVNITTWHDSFDDGKAFSAVLNKFDPPTMNYEDAKKKKPLECVESAFDAAAASPFNVPKLLDAKDVVDGGDTKSLILYTAKLRQACMELEEARIAEQEEARLNALREERENARKLTQDKIDSLTAAAENLRKWCKDKEKGFRDPVASGELAKGLDVADMRRRLADLKSYRTDEKPPRAQEKQALAGLHAALESRLAGAEEAEKSLEEGLEPMPDEWKAAVKASMELASPEALNKLWAAMEEAERAYEAALMLRIEEREKELRFAETDQMTDPLLKRTDELLAWIKKKTEEFVEAKKPENLGDSAAKAAALREVLQEFHSTEKPPKEVEKGEVQEGLREVALRRTQEEREPLPVPYHAGQVEKAWADMEAAAQLLDDQLAERVKQLGRREAEALTDKLQSEADAAGKAWLAKVAAEDDKFKKNVAENKLGNTPAETQALLDAHRADFVNLKKPQWGEEKTSIEDKMRAVDQARSNEGREPVAWSPDQGALSAAWTGCTASAAAYEKALLDKLGALKAEEAERLRRAALVDGALSSLNELLPPMVARANKVDKSAAAAAEVAKKAEAELLPWVKEARERLEGKVDGLTESKGSKRRSQANSGMKADAEASSMQEYEATEKPPKTALYFELKAAVNDAVAAASLQRYAGIDSPVPAAVATLAAIEAEWKALEEAEAKLRVLVWKFTIHAQACGALWERLRRGCQRVGEWLTIEKPALTEDRSTSENEGQAIQWLAEAQSTYAEAAVQKTVVDELTALAAKLNAMNSEYAARIKGAMEGVSSVPGMVPVLASKVERLRAEVSRQKKLSQERLTFGAAVAAFQLSVDQAIEVSNFPITTLDTKHVIERLLSVGTQRYEALEKPPEGATQEAISLSEKLKQEWQESLATLRLRAAEAEQAHKASVMGQPLHEERVKASSDFTSWYSRCVAILVITPETTVPVKPDAHVAKADLERALAVAQSQSAEGEAHARRLEEAARQLESLGAEADKTSSQEAASDALSEEDRTLHADLVAKLSTQLAANLKNAAAEVPAPVKEVIKALNELAEGNGAPMSAEILKNNLQPAHVDFIIKHTGPAVKVETFDPFPLDEREGKARPLPSGKLFSLSAHGFAVLEHLNRARTDPKAYAASLKASLDGRYDGTTMNPPWGGPRLQTKEGEAALNDLVATLSAAQPMGPLKFVMGIAESSQEIADAFGAGTAKKVSELPLPDRLKKFGKHNGAAAEAIVFGVRQPEAIVAQLLLCDGDSSRANRKLLLDPRLTVGGMGLAENAEHDCVATLTMLQLFATNLAKNTSVSCQGPLVSSDIRKVLEAIPSEQVRKLCNDALADGKTVKLDYVIASGVDITIVSPDGKSQKARMDW